MSETKLTANTWIRLGTAAAIATFCFAGIWYAASWKTAQEKDTSTLIIQLTEFRAETREGFRDLSKKIDEHINKSSTSAYRPVTPLP